MTLKVRQCLWYPLIVFFVITNTSSEGAKAQNGKNIAYYCTAEAVGGLFYDKVLKKWVGGAFPPDHKFVLRLKYLRTFVRKKQNELQEDEVFNVFGVTMTDAGNSFAQHCTSFSDNNEVSVGKYNTVFCEAALVDYKLNLDSNRYLGTYAVGYAVGTGMDDEHSDTPAIEGGTCTQIE